MLRAHGGFRSQYFAPSVCGAWFFTVPVSRTLH
jgi:hypothetical protein